MQTFNANIEVSKGNHTWTIPITIDVSFRQTFRQTLEQPAEYEVNDFHYRGLGHDLYDREGKLTDKLVQLELDTNRLENVELL